MLKVKLKRRKSKQYLIRMSINKPIRTLIQIAMVALDKVIIRRIISKTPIKYSKIINNILSLKNK